MADDIVVPFDRKANVVKAQEVAHANRRAKSEELGPRDPDAPTRWKLLLDGEITVQDLDDQELQMMRTRSRLGDFTGRPPAIPARLHSAMRAEFLKRMQSDLESALPTAVKALQDVATKSHYARDRVAAADLLIQRGLGKVPDKVEVTTHEADAWETVLQGVITEDRIERLKEAVNES